MIGAIIGGLIGLIIGQSIASPKFKYLGKHFGEFKGGKGCIGGTVITLACTAAGALLGALIAGS